MYLLGLVHEVLVYLFFLDWGRLWAFVRRRFWTAGVDVKLRPEIFMGFFYLYSKIVKPEI